MKLTDLNPDEWEPLNGEWKGTPEDFLVFVRKIKQPEKSNAEIAEEMFPGYKTQERAKDVFLVKAILDLVDRKIAKVVK